MLNFKKLNRLPDSASRRVVDSTSFLLNIQKPTLRLAESGCTVFRYEYLGEFEAKIGTARKVV
jgi:hypothetical protein